MQPILDISVRPTSVQLIATSDFIFRQRPTWFSSSDYNSTLTQEPFVEMCFSSAGTSRIIGTFRLQDMHCGSLSLFHR